jgi:hypothetical protein
MHKKVCFFLILSTIFAIFTCSKKINQSSLKPPKVVLIPSAADTSLVEKGIDAVPDRNAVRIEWHLSSDDRVTGYEIFRRAGETGEFVSIRTTAETDSFFEDLVPQTQVPVRYYYTVLAVNDEDLRSETGDTLSYMLLKKSQNLLPKGESALTKPVFTWTDPNQAHEYILRLEENIGNKTVWLSVIPADYGSQIQSVHFNFDQKASIAGLVPGQDYRWRIDVRGQNNSGSESEWVALKIR